MDRITETTSRPSRHALRLEYITIILAAGEAALALASGIIAGSVALTAFGTDSVIEMLSAMIVLIQLRAMTRDLEPSSKSVHRAHRAIAVLFFALVAYVVFVAVHNLIDGHHASENGWGLGVCLASLVIMPSLSLAKRRSSSSLLEVKMYGVARLMMSDAAETALCAVLSLSTLLGVALASWAAWWWADPVASLVIPYFALREGLEAWSCDPAPQPTELLQ